MTNRLDFARLTFFIFAVVATGAPGYATARVGGLTPVKASAATSTPAIESDGGKGYDLETPFNKLPEKPLFIFKRSAGLKGDGRELLSSYEDPGGKVLVSEVVEVGPNFDVRSYKFSQKQIGAEAEITVQDGLAKFKYIVGGKTKTSEEKVGDNFIIGPTIVHFLQTHWQEIADGHAVKARFAVPDRLETVGFSYFKEKEETVFGQKVWVIKMKPSSFVIAAIVDPLHFYMTPDGARALLMKGRTQVKKDVNGQFKDLDALTIY